MLDSQKQQFWILIFEFLKLTKSSCNVPFIVPQINHPVVLWTCVLISYGISYIYLSDSNFNIFHDFSTGCLIVKWLFLDSEKNRKLAIFYNKIILYSKGHFTKFYSIKGCELQNFPGIVQQDSVVNIRFVYNPILFEDYTEIFKFTPINRVNLRDMPFNIFGTLIFQKSNMIFSKF